MARWPAASAVGVVLLIGAYSSAWAASSVALHGRSDLDVFFWPVAQLAAAGHPLQIYSPNVAAAGPFSNGPLGLVPLTGVAAVMNAVHAAGDAGARMIVANAVYSIFVILMARTALDVVRRGRGSVEWRLAAMALFLLAPTVWISVVAFSHFEQPVELWLVLLAMTAAVRGRPVAAGVALGLAILTRTTALLYVVPLVLLPPGTIKSRARAKLAAAAAVVIALGLAPFVAADPAGVIHSLIGYRGSEPITSGSVWTLAIGQPWQGVIEHGDIFLAVAIASATCGALALKSRATPASWETASGLLTIAALCFPMLVKTVYPYYFVEPYVFGTVWWLARPGSARNWRMAVPLLITIAALLTQRGQQPPPVSIGAVTGIGASAALAAVIVLVAVDTLRRTRTQSTAVDANLMARPVDASLMGPAQAG